MEPKECKQRKEWTAGCDLKAIKRCLHTKPLQYQIDKKYLTLTSTRSTLTTEG